MRDISLHILDIAQNSINANASLIEISVIETDYVIEVVIRDNGKGMTEEELAKAIDPFYTTRKTRKVGLGLSLLKHNVELTSGKFTIESQLNKGTIVKATFNRTSIDCLPLGDLLETFITLIILHPDVDFIFTHKTSIKDYHLDTRELKAILNEIKINEIPVINWIREDYNG